MTVELLVRALTETASIQSESFPGIFNTPSGRLSQTQSTPKVLQEALCHFDAIVKMKACNHKF